MRRTSPLPLFLWLLMWTAQASAAECTFDRMLKVVIRDVSEGVDPKSFAAQPKTLYRVGTRYGRIEEAKDPAAGLHNLIVVNEPDVWMVNLATKTALHVVDTGATTNFRAPVFSWQGMPIGLRDFEFGCELKFVNAHAAKQPRPNRVDGEPTVQHTAFVGDFRVLLDVGTKDQRPRQVALERPGQPARVLKVEWTVGLAPELTLFQLPKGIAVREAATPPTK